MIFAAALLLVLGVWQIFLGIAAIVKGEFFVLAPNYIYEFSIGAWGWIHLIIGIIMVITGFFLFTGATWARAVGIVLAVLSAIENFFFLPYYPLWSIVVIALDIFVIWALAAADDLRKTSSYSPVEARPAAAPSDAACRAEECRGVVTGWWPWLL
jgi:hypothetical protein